MVNETPELATPRAGSPLVAWFAAQPRRQAVFAYGATLLVGMLLTVWALDLHHGHLRIPYLYQGDTMFYHLITKGLMDHGWFLTNPSLAAPYQLDLRDVPTSDNNFHIALLKLFTLAAGRYGRALNLFFLLSFPLTIVCTLYVLRRLGVSWWAGSLATLLYTFVPYHFTRGEHHLFLSAYYQLPLLLLVVLWLYQDKLQSCAGPRSWPSVRWRSGDFGLSVAVCLWVASSGYYYAFFACFFLLLAGALAAARLRNWRALLLPSGLVGLMTAVVSLHLLPSILHFARYGSVGVVNRLAGEADVYGLRLAQLLLPARWHRVQALWDLKTVYNMRLLINENDDASLGLVGALSFLGLLAWLVLRKPEIEKQADSGPHGLLSQLSVLNLAAVLLGTMGGFGSLVAFFAVPQVRAYTRISIFIAFLVFLAFALWLDEAKRRWAQTETRRTLFYVGSALLCGVALLDQVSPNFKPEHQKIFNEFHIDEDFVRQIEANVPSGAMIFQLPVMSFPENPKVNRMNDYDLLRGYLHSQNLRWSYGTIKGRENDVWLRQVASKPVPEMLETLAWAGFKGLYLDRFGYSDGGEKIENEIKAVIGAPKLGSANNRMIFYSFAALEQRLLVETPVAQHAAKREAALYPLLTVWQNGFSDQEGPLEDHWRWCGAQGRMMLVNRTPHAQKVRLETTLAADYGGNLKLQSPFFNEQLHIDKTGTKLTKTFELPPGEHTLFFECDAQRIFPPNDFRELVFRVRNFKVLPADAVEAAPAAPVATPEPQPSATAKPLTKAAGR